MPLKITPLARNLVLFTILLLSLSLHFKHFSKDLMSIHVWRQSQTQSTILNFYEEDMNILNPRRNERGNTDGIYRLEFPLMQWITACTYKVFGKHLIITRIFMFVVGLLSILGLYKLIFFLFQNEISALIGAWAFNFSPSFYYYTINPLPDNLALCFSIWGMALFFCWHRKGKLPHLLASGLLLSLGALCKLPFIVYFIIPFTYFFMQLLKKNLNKKAFLQATSILSFAILPITWYMYVIPQWHGNIIVQGILGNDKPISVLIDYLLSNLQTTLPESLINYASVPFFLLGFYFFFKKRAYKDSRSPLILGLSTAVSFYFFFEINAIATVHDYYLFPFYPLLFILVAYGAYNLLKLDKTHFRYTTYIILIIIPITCYLRMQGRWDEKSPGFNKDLLTYKTEMQNAVPKNSLVVAGNDISHSIFFYYIDKKGWPFDNDKLSGSDLKLMIHQGAEFLYSDSRTIDENDEISQYLKELILEKGSIRVYRLSDNE